MGSFSLWHWLVVLLVVVLLFGTKKLRNVGGDLGAAIKSFRQGLNEANSSSEEAARLQKENGNPVKPEPDRSSSAAPSNASAADKQQTRN